jgi:hypothetical protein
MTSAGGADRTRADLPNFFQHHPRQFTPRKAATEDKSFETGPRGHGSMGVIRTMDAALVLHQTQWRAERHPVCDRTGHQGA